ncbi:MAG TPA: tetratricopeptide repeat protein, partial [Acidimicrobiales bacterium]|nr:tetratricopeptide repeat protein [Acidimicrobiales bacterium]
RFRLLTSGRRDAPARQQTLRATLDWSYELLSEPEAALFRRLSVFTGSFGLTAAEAVGVGGDVHEDEVLHVLARLVDRSLVVFEPGADVRYRMLETVREYARERLARAGEVEAVERRHAAYFLAVAEEVERLRRTKGGGGPALTRLEQEIDELRAAIDRSLAHGDTDVALRLGSALGWFWFAVSRGEGAGRLNAILAAAGDAPTLARAHALQAAALLEIWPLTDRALPRAAESLALCEQLGDPSGAALSKVILGAVGWSRSELAAEGACLLAEAEATFAEMNDGYHQAMAWRVQAFISVSQGELDRALELSRRSLAAFRELDEAWGISSALHQLGLILRLRRDYPGARQVLEEALDLSRQQGVWDNVHQVLHELGIVAALAGEHDRAAAYHEEAARLARLSGSRGPLARTYNGMGLAARLAGDFDRAAELHRQAAEVAREIDSTGELLWSLTSAGVIEELRGDLQAAEACHLEALELAARIAEPAAAALVLEGLAGVAVARDDAEQAAVLLGAAATGRTGAGVRFTRDVPDGERVVERARARLGEREFAQAFERGRALGVEAVARPLLDRVGELR